MSSLVLVHGGCRGRWAWKRDAQLLRKEGHDVYTPTLTGLADRNHLLHADINLSTHIQKIVNLIQFEELDQVVFCGHSYAGMVISGVVDQISERISSLVYLDAWLPKTGDSIMTLSLEVYRLMRVRDAGQYRSIACSPTPAALLHVNGRDRLRMDSMATLQPFATMVEAIQLQGNHLKMKKKAFALTSGWEPNLFKQFYECLQKDPKWVTRAIGSGYNAMLDKPGEVASLLREAAGV